MPCCLPFLDVPVLGGALSVVVYPDCREVLLAALDLGDFGWAEELVDISALGLADHVDLLLTVLLLEDRPVGVVVTHRRRDEELGRQLHEQFDVVPAVEDLGELTFDVRVVGDVVELGLLRVLDLVKLVDEPVGLLEAVLLQFTELVDGAVDFLVLDALDHDLGQH